MGKKQYLLKERNSKIRKLNYWKRERKLKQLKNDRSKSKNNKTIVNALFSIQARENGQR